MTATQRSLIWPVYVPTVTYAAGASALLPAQIILALSLGFSATEVTLIGTWLGAFAVVASFSAGYLVQGLGERVTLVVTTTLGIVGLMAAWGATIGHFPGARWVLVAALTVFAVTDAVWSIARQSVLADLAPPSERGRVMNLFGASQRIGRVIGPFVAAAVIALGGADAVLVASSVIVALAALLMVGRLRDTATPAHGAPPAEVNSKRAVHGLFLLGLGVLSLAAVRVAKETLVPLWGSEGLHLPGATIALIVGVASSMELILFWPAGVAMDRLGRTPVVVSCLTTMGSGLVLMPVLPHAWWFVGTAMLIGLGDGIGSGIVKTLGVDLAPDHGRGRFLGWWQSIASVGSFAAPALAGLVISLISLAAVLPTVGLLGLFGAAWMAWWTPKFVPRSR